MEHADPYFYHTEATMPPGMACYIERASDAALLKALREGQYAIMLSSRKVGKSSLMEHAFVRLREEGIFVVKKELTEAGDTITVEGWYAGLVQELVGDAMLRNQFEVQADWREWWRARGDIPPGQRFIDFVRNYFLAPTDAAWVIAIDEIDTTIPLGFSDDFFATVRSCQNKRASDPLFARLTFLLAGVASPAQLIKDNRRTPFNIGHAVGLNDFTADEAKVLLRGLGLPQEANHPLLQRVLYWTGGHPYLTQRLFRQLAEVLEQADKTTSDWQPLVDTAVQASFFHASARTTEAHFHDIARRRIGNLRGMAKRRILGIYQRALNKKVVQDDALSAPIVELKLCGLLVCAPQDASKLVLRNRVYGGVFDAAWVKEEMPRNYRQGIAAAMVVGMLVGAGVILQVKQDSVADLSAQIERAANDVPTVAYTKLKQQRGQAKQANKLMGQYWVRQARIASAYRSRDEAALVWLKALTFDENLEANIQARNALAGSLPQVDLTIRHNTEIEFVAANRDGRLLAVVSGVDNMVRVWDMETRKTVGMPMPHPSKIMKIEFSSDGRQLLTMGADMPVHVWDLETGNAVMKGTIVANFATFSPNGKRIAMVDSRGEVLLWDVKSKQMVSRINAKKERVTSVTFSPNGRQLATTNNNKTVQLFIAETGQPLGEPIQHDDIILSVNIGADGRRLLVASAHIAKLWDIPKGRMIRHTTDEFHDNFFGQNINNPSAFSPDGQRAVMFSGNQTAQLMDVETGIPLGQPMQHITEVTHLSFSRDGKQLVTASKDGAVGVWDGENGQPLADFLQHPKAVIFVGFSTNNDIITASADRTIRIWHRKSKQKPGIPINVQGKVAIQALSPDQQQIIIVNDRKTIRIVSADSGLVVGQAMTAASDVYAPRISRDGRRVLSYVGDNSIVLWDTETGSQLGQTRSCKKKPNSMMFSVDYRQFLTLCDNEIIQRWATETGKLLPNPIRSGSEESIATLSETARWFVTVERNGIARVRDTATNQPHGKAINVRAATLGRNPFNRPVVVGDGRVLYVMGEDTLWDVATGKKIDIAQKKEGSYYTVYTNNYKVKVANNEISLFDFKLGRFLGKGLKFDDVDKAKVSDDGQRLIVFRDLSINWFSRTSTDEWVLEKTIWHNGSFDQKWENMSFLLGPSSNTIRIIESPIGNSLVIRDVHVQHKAELGLPELPGKPAQLLADYQKRFALRFENAQNSPKIVPVLPGDVLPEPEKTPPPK